MKKLVIGNAEFRGCVLNILQQLAQEKWIPDYIVGITRGGLTPAVMISQYLNVPLQTLNVSLRDSEIGPESNLWMAEDAFGYADSYEGDPSRVTNTAKNILLVDDINDTGATFNWIMEDWKSGCLPKDPTWNTVWNNNVKFAVIVDNTASKCNVKMDFVGMEVNKAEDDVWVEFPYENWWTK